MPLLMEGGKMTRQQSNVTHLRTLLGQIAEIQSKIRLLENKLHQFPESVESVDREIGFLENELSIVLQSVDFALSFLESAKAA